MSIANLESQDVRNNHEFDNHELISFLFDEHTYLVGIIAIHRKNGQTPSFGATRMLKYNSMQDGISDVLRLSRLMSYKAALAGLPCGGAKAVLFETPVYVQDPAQRRRALETYAAKLAFLGTSFVTGTDVGISQSDLEDMRKMSTQVVGFNNNTTTFTGLGVFESLKASLQETYGTEDLLGKSFAIQGLGKIGTSLLEYILPHIGSTGKIYISDINTARVSELLTQYPHLIAVPADTIHKQDVDVFLPCALAGVLNDTSITEIKANIIVGGANNQLASDSIADKLYERGILYTPDYIANSGGLIAVYDEYEHPNDYVESRVATKVAHIRTSLEEIFGVSKTQHVAPNRVANILAEQIYNAYE